MLVSVPITVTGCSGPRQLVRRSAAHPTSLHATSHSICRCRSASFVLRGSFHLRSELGYSPSRMNRLRPDFVNQKFRSISTELAIFNVKVKK